MLIALQGLTISELCAAKGWPRRTFYDRTRAAAERVALFLNSQPEAAIIPLGSDDDPNIGHYALSEFLK